MYSRLDFQFGQKPHQTQFVKSQVLFSDKWHCSKSYRINRDLFKFSGIIISRRNNCGNCFGIRFNFNHLQRKSFCDGFPLETTGETIEHFRPKSSFPLLSYLWANLLYCCKYCNENKGENLERRLIKPNDINYSFETYFLFDYDSGKIEPTPALIGIDKLKAENTILLYGLNEHNRPYRRKFYLKQFQDTQNPNVEDFPYRFIF